MKIALMILTLLITTSAAFARPISRDEAWAVANAEYLKFAGVGFKVRSFDKDKDAKSDTYTLIYGSESHCTELKIAVYWSGDEATDGAPPPVLLADIVYPTVECKP